MDSFPKKDSKRSTNKLEKRVLPSQVQRIKRTKEVQRNLSTLCDKEDDDSSEKSFITARTAQTNRRMNHVANSVIHQKVLEVELTDSSSEDSSSEDSSSEDSSVSHKKNNRKERDRTMKFSNSVSKSSKLVKGKNTLKRYVPSDSDNDSTNMSSIKPIAEKRNAKSEKIVRRKTNSRACSFDSESNEDDTTTNKTSSVLRRTSKDNKQQHRKMDNFHNARSNDKTKRYDSTDSKSEDEEFKKQNKRKTQEDEGKCGKLSMQRQFSKIQEDDSDNSSSKEFQKVKLQKVNRNKYSKKQLVDLERDYTKSPRGKNFTDNRSLNDSLNEQSDRNLDNITKILEAFKEICSNFQTHMEALKQMYGKKDVEQYVLKSIEKVDKLKTMLEKKQKDLTDSYQLWIKSKRRESGHSSKVDSDNEQLSEKGEERMMNKNKYVSSDMKDGDRTAVSECDSEEIFSANETESSRKIPTTSRKNATDASRTENYINNNEINTDTQDEMSNASRSDDRNDRDGRDDVTASPVLGLKERKNNTERSSIKQSFSQCDKSNNEMDENSNANSKQANIKSCNEEIEIESSLRNDCKSVTLKNNETDRSNNRVINESMDMFDTSFEDTEKSKSKVDIDMKKSTEKGEFSHTYKSLDSRDGSMQDKAKVSSEKEKMPLLSDDNKGEKNSSNQNNQRKMTPVTNEKVYDCSKKTNTDDNESLDDAETLAKQNLLATTTDSDTSETSDEAEALAKKALLATDSDTMDVLADKKVLNPAKDLFVNDTNRTEKKNGTEDNDSDVNSVSTVKFSTFIKKTDTNAEGNVAENKISCKEINSSDEDAKREEVAKSALLASTSDDSIHLSSEKLCDDQLDKLDQEINSSDENAKKEQAAKKALLESNSEDSIFLSSLSSSEKYSDGQLDKRSRREATSSDESSKREQAAKTTLLESNSDDSALVSSKSEKSTDKKSELDSSEKNYFAKIKLLASSDEDSNSEQILPESTISALKNTKRNREPENDEESMVSRKRRKLKLNKNSYYRNDKKLRMSCRVHLTRLSTEVLKCYSRALKKSREYLEHKEFKSLVNLDKLEKRRTNNAMKDFDSLTDSDNSSSKVSRNSNKPRKEKAKIREESLMDHLKSIENGDVATIETDSDTEEPICRINTVDDVPVSNEALISEADRIAKENLLNSSDSNENGVIIDSDDNINDDKNEDKTENKKKKYQKKPEEKISKQDDNKKNKSDWRRDKLLTDKFSDTDSDTERKKWGKKQEKIVNKLKENNSNSDDEEKAFKSKKKKKAAWRRILDSDSDVKIMDCTSDDSSKASDEFKANLSDSDVAKKEKEKLRRRRRKHDSNSSDTDSSLTEKKPKPRRKRIKKMASDSDSSSVEMKNSQGSTPGKSGRKNIRKVLKDKQVAEDTKLAAKEEEERLKRIAERQALYNEMYEIRLAGEEKVDKLVLDFDTETKEELVTVHEELVKRLKPHQAQGIKFMWDACFESLERLKNTSGSGCIIAHCMGLGKTLQVIALTHTLLTHEATNVKTVLIVCPLSTVLNWLNEYKTWLRDLDDIEVYELTKFKKNFERKFQLQRWQKTGGVMIIGYEMFRNLTGPNRNIRKGMKEVILECLVDPGADLIVCDEGHLLKNEDTALSKCMRNVKTLRRIVLTGTPLQNNLIEYHCMVQFVKPNLLGTKKEFLNRFVNPITNGQFDDSTAYDVKLMKKRAHVLHKMLEGSVQRFDYSVLTPFLPPKQEYVIFVRLTDTQIKMYQYYLENLARRGGQGGQGGTLFADFQALQRIWTHPVVLRLNAEKIEKANEKKDLSDSEGSLKDFINDDTTDVDSTSNSSNSNSDSDVQAIDEKDVPKRRTRNNPGEEELEEEIKVEPSTEIEWWSQFVQPEHFEDMRVSAKLLLLFGILKESEQIGDKVLVFSQSLYSLTLIEEFLRRIDDQTQNGESCENLENHTGSWSLGLDYFRLDGSTSPENRNIWCNLFNKPTNTRARLFLISTRAGGLGINLTAANRVIIFDASWNPSHDVQSIFRIYRFGQKKPCYVYRFLAAGTMEEKIYNRQVTKLSLSCRVVDEQQIERHYSNHNLNELYMWEGYNDKEKPTLNLPKDRLLAEIFLKFKDIVENYHEHDSLLENKAEEELNEEERKQAWLEYEEEKKGKPLINPMNMAYQNNMLLQQYNMMINSMQSNIMSQNMPIQNMAEYDNLQQLIRKDYPNATPEQQKLITNRALMEMYNYWEKQATLYNKQQPMRANQILPNYQQRPQATTFQQMSSVSNNSNVHINQPVSQLNTLLSGGQSMNYVNVNKPAQSNAQMGGDLLPNIFTYRNTPSSNNKGGQTDQDVIEVIPTTSNVGVARQSGMSSTPVAALPIDNTKIQEE
ncbi:transcriptional regulator ATRX [Monomorium pharaonis]|uniref:transcriptional regulator ATRX n=1 Tax=Monomorium pharaonis TaxID=307658 RepID=UPI00063EFCD5|nr:transcriptional regulator ATRX [Monomorium pharaonis]